MKKNVIIDIIVSVVVLVILLFVVTPLVKDAFGEINDLAFLAQVQSLIRDANDSNVESNIYTNGEGESTKSNKCNPLKNTEIVIDDFYYTLTIENNKIVELLAKTADYEFKFNGDGINYEDTDLNDVIRIEKESDISIHLSECSEN